jgi:hypothetical protein
MSVTACSVTPSPGPSNTALTPATHTAFPITAAPHAVDCAVCHGNFDSFSQFSCFNCHGHEVENLTDQMHLSVANYAYDSNACYHCHSTGAQQSFDHAGIQSGCAACHDVGNDFAALPVAGFTHITTTADCGNCHNTATWLDATGGPASLVADANKNFIVDAGVPTYVGNSIVSMVIQAEMLPQPMNHTTTSIDGGVLTTCSNCHQNTSSGASYYPGNLHDSLASLGLPEPSTCADCHSGPMPAGTPAAGFSSMPIGFVGPTATHPSRTPSSGEMKHDAVTWANSAPGTTPLVSADCSTCHISTSASRATTWSMGLDGNSPALFHAALTNASLNQPSSCLDCHANTRPTSLLISADGGCPSGSSCAPAALPSNVEFDHTVGDATGDCSTCHTASETTWVSWSGGVFHTAGSSTPSTCLPCHTDERPTSTANWVSTTWSNSPFDYGSNVTDGGSIHGDGLDCVTCHNGPGTGAWNGTQNWVGGSFSHDATTVASQTCFVCHTTQRPTTLITTPDGGSFDHSANGAGDCFACHQATVIRGSYVNYNNPATGTLPGGDWQGGVSYPGSVLSGSGTQSVTVTLLTLQRSPNNNPNNLVTSLTSTQIKLINEMLHTSAQVPSQIAPSPPSTNCYHCHVSTGTTVTQYAGGVYHAALSDAGLPQPSSGCLDCHAQMRPEVSPGQPTGIVEQANSDLRAMDHNAMFASGSGLTLPDGGTATGVAQMDCSDCHRSPFTTPGVDWSGGVFHTNIGAAVPQDCTTCHYPLMTDSTVPGLTNGTLYAMHHDSSQMTFQNCSPCHAGALSQATTSPPASSEFSGGTFHANLPAQPTRCNDCHLVSEPTTSTQGSTSYALASGGTSSNSAQWMSHAVASVTGLDCATCHLTDAKTSGSTWNKGSQFHANVANPTNCKACHGLGNGSSTVGNNNNMPQGLTNSKTQTTAANDATTGVPAGTFDQIDHSDINVTNQDCNFCHTQVGPSSNPAVAGKEWAQASFHQSFTGATSLTLNGTTGRCSNCHLNVKPSSSSFPTDHSTFTNAANSQDCSACHSFPGTGTASAPNWLGATAGTPACIVTGGFTVSNPPASNSTTTEPAIPGCVPHPSTSGLTCAQCHTGGTPTTGAIGYDHASSSTPCMACHEAGSTLIGPAVWNSSTSTGDTRPYTRTVPSNGNGKSHCDSNSCPDGSQHWYGEDCADCHSPPSGIATAKTGSAYTSAWSFSHPPRSCAGCYVCHTSVSAGRCYQD